MSRFTIIGENIHATRVLRLNGKRVDLNDDGNIDKEEFKMGLKEIGIEDLSQNEIDEVMSFLDTDNNGTVDLEEFKFYFAK